MAASDDPFLRNPTNDSSLENGLPDDLVAELDQALESIIQKNPESVEAVGTPEEFIVPMEDLLDPDLGMRQMQETYLEITRQAMGPLDRYMKALSEGEYTRELMELSELVVQPLIEKTEAVGLQEHAQDLTFFRSLLLLALGERDETGSKKAMEEVVMKGFEKLSARFRLSYRGYRPAIRNLILFYRSLRTSDKITNEDIRLFFSIGVPSLTWVRRSKVGDLVSLSGISPAVIREIRNIAYAYRSVPAVDSARLARDDLFAPKPLPQTWPSISTADVVESDVFEATEGIIPLTREDN